MKDPNQVLKTIGQTAQLLFRPALCYAPPYTPATETTKGQKAKKIVSPGALPSTCPTGEPAGHDQPLLGGANSSNPYPNAVDPALSAYPSTGDRLGRQGRHGRATRPSFFPGSPVPTAGSAIWPVRPS